MSNAPKPGFLRKLGSRLSRLVRTPQQPTVTIWLQDHIGDKSWAAGDMAECTNGDGWFAVNPGGFLKSHGPALGEVRVVSAVTIEQQVNGVDGLFLSFVRYPGKYTAHSFRKLQPTADTASVADGEFLRDFNERLKPAKVVARTPAGREHA